MILDLQINSAARLNELVNKVGVDLKINVEPNDSSLWCRMFCPTGCPQLIIKLPNDMPFQ